MNSAGRLPPAMFAVLPLLIKVTYHDCANPTLDASIQRETLSCR